jgi:Na+:H+ antiporter, NhaA family
MARASRRTPTLFGPGAPVEARRIADILRNETVGGALLLTAAALALGWANSPWARAYDSLRELTLGPSLVHLDLSLGIWAADGLLAVFFFVAGLELKRELVAGDLRDPSRAVVPVAAALGGVIAPAVLYLLINADTGGRELKGWAIPTGTDIAFALAVLAVIGRHLQPALRTFMLTLAVVDDLLAITIIAVFYTEDPVDPSPASGDRSTCWIRRAGAAAYRVVVVAVAAGHCDVDLCPCLRGARHCGRRTPGLHSARSP